MKRILALTVTVFASLILVGGTLSRAQTPVTVTLYPSQETLMLPNTPTSFVQVDLPFGTYDISAIFQGAHAGGDLDHVFLYAPTGETTPQFPRGHALYEAIGSESKRITFPTPSGLSYISIYLFFVDLGDLGDNPGFATVNFVKVPSSGSNDVVSVNVYPNQHTIILPSTPTNYLRVDLPFGTYNVSAAFHGAHAGGDIDHVFFYGPTGETTPQWPRGHAIHDVIGIDQKLYTFPTPSGLPYMSVYLFFADLGNLGDNPGTVTVTFSPTSLPTDNEPPQITLNSYATLWSPNHNYEIFTVADMVQSVRDLAAGPIDLDQVQILSASSDEPEDAAGNGDGNTLNDIVIASDGKCVHLRAERQGNGNGRVYRVNLSVSDPSGNVATATYLVSVPKNQGNGSTAIDDGIVYTVNVNQRLNRSLIARAGGGAEMSVDIPSEYSLSNYPNPFNPSTVISFSIPTNQHVQLNVYNSIGQLVRALVNDERQAGTYRVVWGGIDNSGRQVSSGMYFYQFLTNNCRITEKMIMLR